MRSQQSGPLFQLQLLQKDHDQRYHADIYYLPYPERMTHFVLHFAKYAGRLAEAMMKEEWPPQSVEGTLADTFIVALAASDVLNMDLDDALTESEGRRGVTLVELAESRRPGPLTDEGILSWWLPRLAAPAGRMAKAMESLDHMEPLNVREVLAAGLVDIVDSCLGVAGALEIDLEKVTHARWDVVASRRLL